MKLCGIPSEILEKHGAVSDETAKALACGVRSALSSNLGISITGIAGPGGGSAEKPVGLTYFGLSDGVHTESRHRIIPGDRESIRERAAHFAISMLREFLLKLRP